MDPNVISPTPDPAQPTSEGLPYPEPPKKRKRRVWMAVALLILVGGGAYWWFAIHKAAPAAKTQQGAVVSAHDYSFVPRFSQIGAYAEYEDAKWYAAPAAVIKISKTAPPKFYAHDDGLPVGMLSSLTVHDGKLWVGSQYGTATLKADESGFTEVTIGGKTSTQQAVQNGRIFNDTAAGKLYLSSFTNFYEYNDTANAWATVAGSKPVDANAMVMNNDYVATSVNGPRTTVWVYSKKKSTWEPRPLSGLSDQSARVLAIGSDLFVMGRAAGYSSCSDAGKLTATIAYHLDAAGQWQPMTTFNNDKNRPELLAGSHVKSPTATAYTGNCGGSAKPKVYDLKFADGTLSLTNERQAPEGVGGTLGDDGEQQAVVNEVAKETGLYPYTQALAVNQSNEVIFGYAKAADYGSTPIAEGLAIANGSDFASSREVALAGYKRGDVVRPILCDGQMKYAFVGTPGATEGGPSQTWDSAKLISVNDTKTAALVDLDKDVASPVFACSDEKITWLGTSGVKQFNRSSKKTTDVGSSIGTKLSMVSGQAYALPNGDLWMLAVTGTDPATATGTAYYFDSGTGEIAKVVDTGKAQMIEAASEKNLWVSGPLDGYKTTLTVYDKQGEVLSSSAFVTPLKLAATSDVTATVMSGTSESPGIGMVSFASLDSSGRSTTVPLEKVAVHAAFSAESPGAAHITIYDASRGRVWVTDDLAGLFSIPQ